jgi:hypothetical protein
MEFALGCGEVCCVKEVEALWRMVGLFLLFQFISSVTCENRVGVGLTTIPPRFATVYHVIQSWFEQEKAPDVIVLFIPEKYHNFIGESRRDHTKNMKTLTSELRKHYSRELDDGKIVIRSVKTDHGPITKYLGLFQNFEQLQSKYQIDYWVIGDDDVRYSSNTISDYMRAIAKNPRNKNKILTHFKSHPRINAVVNNSPISIQHLQGVDTILFPTSLLSSTPSFTFPAASSAVSFLHSKCPESFYQDDYVISFLVSLAHSEDIQSIWSGQKVAHHVNGVSKAGQQMHTHKDVFHREEETKHCIAKYSNEISQIVKKFESSNEL